MTFDEYQTLAQRTSATTNPFDKVLNGALGLAGESGEFCDIIKKATYQGHSYDKEHMAKELGDVLWYVAEAARGLHVSMDKIAQMNIDKLKARYPDGFDADRSNNRKDGDV